MNLEEDKKLYQEFLEGNKESFEKLITKYKTNLIYFIYKYVKNVETAEDIFQDTIIYLLDKKEIYNFKYSFKSFIYMVAKSRALNYLKQNESVEIVTEDDIYIEEDLLEDIIISKERKEKIKKVICRMKEEHQMVVYLCLVEGLSYEEAGKIMNKTTSQIKNLVHRARINLRKLLIEERVVEMRNNKVIKLLLAIIIIGIISSGIVIAVKNSKGKARMTPTYTSNISKTDTNKVWVGTFNIVWNDLMNDVVGGPIEFEDGESKLAEELNKQTFTINELSEDSYFKIHGPSTYELKKKIENGIKNKFNETSKVLDNVEWGNPASYTLYAMLKKEFNYLERFPNLPDASFNGSKEKVKYFGITGSTEQTAGKNIEILFHNSDDDLAVKLKTKEGEEVYLYKTTGEGKSFEELYNEMLERKTSKKDSVLEEDFAIMDTIKIPYIKINDEINYDELCGRYIKGTDWFIAQALQTIDFELNNVGGSVKSEALIELQKSAELQDRTGENYIFDSDFVVFLKEGNKDKPYFALKVDNTDVLVEAD